METAATRTRAIEIIPTGDALGAEVRGVDIASGLSDAEIQQIKAAWREHLVVVMRDQTIDDPQLIAFTRRFGELDPPGPNPYGGPIYPEHPELNIISNIVEDGRPIGNLGAGEAVWHADMTYLDLPPLGAVLYAVELPPVGGDTQFCNMYAAYEALPEKTKREIEGLRAVHDAAHNSAGMLRNGYENIDDVRQTPGARHPLVRTDRESGRRCLFLGRRPHSYVLGLEVPESEALLDRLWAHATQDRFVTTHSWRVGDVLMWNNRAVLHRRDAFDAVARRRLHRAQLKGEGPIE
ncbi:MAG: TauD/TfdA family dioxygenase [Gammaproteobacteria bacterium]|nr:TauD/TfdA family dioxygenase [Gammaproteobacteria bacterium]MDH3411849.1 TauD/TfdA family dioxygenase [Gammaproteobacteria bacterium]